MFVKHIIPLLLIFLSTPCFSQTSIIGKWRRTANPHHKNTIYKQPEPGDLEIYANNTFHIEGDSANDSIIPGWHTFQEMNGTWEVQSNKKLTLWVQSKESNLFLSFVIIRLSREELVIRFYWERDNKKGNIQYLRL